MLYRGCSRVAVQIMRAYEVTSHTHHRIHTHACSYVCFGVLLAAAGCVAWL